MSIVDEIIMQLVELCSSGIGFKLLYRDPDARQKLVILGKTERYANQVMLLISLRALFVSMDNVARLINIAEVIIEEIHFSEQTCLVASSIMQHLLNRRDYDLSNVFHMTAKMTIEWADRTFQEKYRACRKARITMKGRRDSKRRMSI